MGFGIVLKCNELESLDQGREGDLLGEEVQKGSDGDCSCYLILDLEGEYGLLDLNGLREEFLEGILVR